jgi:hypothetical protein
MSIPFLKFFIVFLKKQKVRFLTRKRTFIEYILRVIRVVRGCRNVLLTLFFGDAVHHLIHSKDKQNDNAYNYKDAQHSLPHILEREQEAREIEVFKN